MLVSYRGRKWGVSQGLVTGDIVRTTPTYNFQSACVRMISEISAEVKLAHHFVNKGKRMTEGRIDADERNNIGVRKFAGGPGLLEESLGVRYSVLFQSRSWASNLQSRSQRDQILGKNSTKETSRQQSGLATTLAIPPRRAPRKTGPRR